MTRHWLSARKIILGGGMRCNFFFKNRLLFLLFFLFSENFIGGTTFQGGKSRLGESSSACSRKPASKLN